MSWGKDPSKWGKPVTVRMLPHQLAQLNLVLKRRNEKRNGWERLWTWSSLILDLVAAAAIQDDVKQLQLAEGHVAGDELPLRPRRSARTTLPARKKRKKLWKGIVGLPKAKRPKVKKTRRPKAKRSSRKR